MNKVLNLEQMGSLLKRMEGSSVRITVKVSEKTLSIIELLQLEFKGWKFKELFAEILESFLELLNETDTPLKKSDINSKLQIRFDDSKLKSQKTFVVTANTKRVLDELSSLLEIDNRSIVFNWVLTVYCMLVFRNKEKIWGDNLQIYLHSKELGDKFYKITDENESGIIGLFDKHDPPLNDLLPELNSSNPVEHFLAEIATTSITLTNSLATLEELIHDCQKKIAVLEKINRSDKA